MAEDDSIEEIALRVRSLGFEGFAVLGDIPSSVLSVWRAARADIVVLTGERKRHILEGHPEMQAHIPELIRTVRQPDEIHRNKRDPMVAIFWRLIEEQDSYLRVALLLSEGGALHHSVMSAWRVRRKDFEREGRRGRLVWKREEGA